MAAPILIPELTIQITFDPPASAYGRKLAKITREAFRAMAETWHRKYLLLHFQRGNAERYGFQPRKPAYQRRKQGRPDLVWRGLMRDMMRREPEIKAFPSRARLRMLTPSYVRIVPRSGRPNLYAESKRLAPDEVRALKEVARDVCETMLLEMKETRKVLINGE